MDIVITKFELVCFECYDDDGKDVAEIDDGINKPNDSRGHENFRKRHGMHDNLVMTHGGKGFEISKVARGRKIVSRIDLDSVDIVKVQRHVRKKSKSVSVDTNEGLNHKHIRSEYWLSGEDPSIKSEMANTCSDPSAELNRCWDAVDDDHLYLHSTQGVILVRFIGDLEAFEEAKKNEVTDKTFSTIALQWCKSIQRCSSQFNDLRASYDEEGANHTSEPYLEIVDESRRRRGLSLRGTLRRVQSFNYGNIEE